MVSSAKFLRRCLNSFRCLSSLHSAAAITLFAFPALPAQSQTLPAAGDPRQAVAQDRAQRAAISQQAQPQTENVGRDGIQGANEQKQRVSRDARQEAREKLEETIAGRTDSSADLRAPDLGVWFLQPGVSGLTVADVANQSAFAGAGLAEGDRILSINGQTVADEAQFLQMLTSPSLANQTANITVARGNERKTVSVPTGPLMQGVAAADPLHNAGLLVDERNPSQIVVQRVFPRTPAFYAGLRAGDVLTSVDGQGLSSIDNLSQALQQGNELSVLGVTRNGQARQLTLGRVDASVRTAMRPTVQTGSSTANQVDQSGLNTAGGVRPATSTIPQTNVPGAAGNVLPPSAIQPLPGSPRLSGSPPLPGSPGAAPAATAPPGLPSSQGVVNPAIRGGANPPAGTGTFGGTGATSGGAGAVGGTGAARGGSGSTAGGAGATGGTGAAAGGTGSSAGAGTSGGTGAGGTGGAGGAGAGGSGT